MKPCKKEELLLDETLKILNEDGVTEAYRYLLAQKEHLDDHSSQLYNFLYCLASLAGAKSEALAWLKEAIVEKGYWYRPEVFEDEDLNLIRDCDEFTEYKKISDKKYHQALKESKTLCTWEEVKKDKLALVLHGNQQNMFFGRDYWNFLDGEGYQLEYVQSKTIDSHNLYRWEDEGETQLDEIIFKISWGDYSHTALCGFSAGCNEILKTLLRGDVKCGKIILVCPWIPMIDKYLNELITALKNVKIGIICGGEDEDCLPYAKKLYEEAKEKGLDCDLKVIGGWGHSYPC